MVKIYTTIFLVLSFTFVSAQTLDITSQYGIGSAGDDNLKIYSSLTGDLVIGVSTRSGATGNKTTNRFSTIPTGYDCWFFKTDVNFNTLWDVSYGGDQNQRVSNMYNLSTGELVVNCISNSIQNTGNKTSASFGLYDNWILFLDSNGDDILQGSYGGTGIDYAGSISHPLDPAKLILCTSSDSPISGNKTIAPNTSSNVDAWLGVLEYDPQLGVLELVETSKAKAFPNPSSSDVTIEFTALKEPASIVFYSEDGKLLDNKKLIENTSSIKWNTKYQGIVFYTIEGENTFMQGKLVFE